MPSISKNMMSLWRNYHLTEQGRYVPRVESDPDAAVILSQSRYPDGTVRDTANIHCTDLVGMPGPAMFAATGRMLCEYIKEVLDPPELAIRKRPAIDLVPIGRGWSFSALVGGIDTQIDMTGLSGFAMARLAHMNPNTPYLSTRTAFVLGGTRLRELLSWAQAKPKPKLSVPTSGTHLGLTVAGAIANGSHGSRLGFGGMQDLVTGIHLITGPETSVWIERASKPVLNDATVKSFTGQSAIRDDAVFEDALVHLGGMGLINGVTLNMVNDAAYALMIKFHPINEGWLRDIAQGNYRPLAKALGRDAAPVFYEMTLDPFNWDSNPAIHNLYFNSRQNSFTPDIVPVRRSFADLLDTVYSSFAAALIPLGSENPDLPPVFDLYKSELAKTDFYKQPPQNARWNQLHGDDITSGYPGALYNASFAVQRDQIAEILPLLCEAVKGLPPTFLFTLRFVSHASGTLAFTRFPESCVIEIDGFSKNTPLFGPQIGHYIVDAARRMRACLDGANGSQKRFEYSMHWGKLGDLNKDKVWADFGPPDKPGSPIHRWRATRAKLLNPRFADILWNQALVNYGLIDPPRLPDALPPPPPPPPQEDCTGPDDPKGEA